jgi:hypothetical protein
MCRYPSRDCYCGARRLAGLLIAATCHSKWLKAALDRAFEYVLVLFDSGAAAVDDWEYVTIDWEHSLITRERSKCDLHAGKRLTVPGAP